MRVPSAPSHRPQPAAERVKAKAPRVKAALKALQDTDDSDFEVTVLCLNPSCCMRFFSRHATAIARP